MKLYDEDKVQWIQTCFLFVQIFYLRVPLEVFMKVLERRSGFRISEEELRDISASIPSDLRICEIIEDYVVASEIYQDPDFYREILYLQGDRDYYIPTYDEIMELAENGCLIHKKAYEELSDFLIRKVHMEEKQSKSLLTDLWEMIVLVFANDLQGPLQWLLDQIDQIALHVNRADGLLQEAIDLYMTVYNSTNMPCNRGYAAVDMPRRALRPGNAPGNMPGNAPGNVSGNVPVIMAGSRRGVKARLPKEGAPGIRKMSFELDLDGDSDEFLLETQ